MTTTKTRKSVGDKAKAGAAQATMKAAVIHGFGDFDALQYEDIATPEVKPGNVLIKVLAAGVNRFDHYIREGSVVPELPFPHILGQMYLERRCLIIKRAGRPDN